MAHFTASPSSLFTVVEHAAWPLNSCVQEMTKVTASQQLFEKGHVLHCIE